MAEIFTVAETALLERQKLPAAFGPDAIRPSYDGLGLANVAALTTQWLSPEAPSLSEQTLPCFNPNLLAAQAVTDAWETWLQLAPINHVVLLIIDALGYDQLQTLMHAGDAPGLAVACVSPQAFFMPVTSVFPTATAAALTSAATAYAPAQHGVVSTNVYLREIGNVVNLIEWRPSLSPTKTPYSDAQLNPTNFVPVPNIYLRMEKAGVSVEIVNFSQYKEKSIHRFTSAGSQAGEGGYSAYLTPADGFAQLRDRLQVNRSKGKSFTHLYVSNVDSVSHRYGPLGSYYRAEVAALDFALKRELFDPLAGFADTVLLLVADHGQRYAHADKILWLDQHPNLNQLLFVPATGESQGRYLHLRHGAEAAAKEYVQQHLAEHFLALNKAEVVKFGLFGLPGQPLNPGCDDRTGDLLLLSRDDWACFDQNHSNLVGIHGGLSRAEMLIPFLAYRF